MTKEQWGEMHWWHFNSMLRKILLIFQVHDQNLDYGKVYKREDVNPYYNYYSTKTKRSKSKTQDQQLLTSTINNFTNTILCHLIEASVAAFTLEINCYS